MTSILSSYFSVIKRHHDIGVQGKPALSPLTLAWLRDASLEDKRN